MARKSEALYDDLAWRERHRSFFQAVRRGRRDGRTVLTVDPGVEGAFAFWESRVFDEEPDPERDELGPAHVELFDGAKVRQTSDWWDRAAMANFLFEEALNRRAVCAVACEWARYMGSGGGSAVAESGSLVKLIHVTSLFAATAVKRGVAFLPVPVNLWKGQLPKKIVAQRIRLVLPKRSRRYKSHMWDAVGIGLWLKGFLQ
jgi:hypothetical protein